MQKGDFSILVIDDDEIARDVVVSLLSQEGFSVHSARDGLEGIRTLKTREFHLVITDLRMPGADGIEVLKTALRLNPKTAVVILTAYGTLDNALEAIQIGAYDYITKPFKLQEIIIVVENAFKRAGLMRENEELRLFLRDTYRDLETGEGLNNRVAPEATLSLLERLGRLEQMGVIDRGDVEVLKEKLIRGSASDTGIGSR